MPAKRKTTSPEDFEVFGDQILCLAIDLEGESPDKGGLARRSLFSMVSFVGSFLVGPIAQQFVAQMQSDRFIRLVAADKATTIGPIQCDRLTVANFINPLRPVFGAMRDQLLPELVSSDLGVANAL